MRNFLAAACIMVSACCSFGSNAIQTEQCPSTFARFGRFAESTSVTTIIPPRVKDDLLQADRQLSDMIELDSTFNVTANTAKASTHTRESSNAIVAEMSAQLAELGYVVNIEKRAAGTYKSGATTFELPERDVLAISSGTATGKFARELRRVERDTAARMRNPRLPDVIREKMFGVSVDPMAMLIAGTRGTFAASPSLGYGMILAPALFAGREEVVVEILRHELRHSKSYFDRISGVPTVNGARLAGIGVTELNPGSYYAKGFSVEETYAFTSNVRTAQADLGQLTEKIRKAMASKNPPTADEMDLFIEDIKAIQSRGILYSNQVSHLNRITLDFIGRARAKLADPLLSKQRLATTLSLSKDESHPGLIKVHIQIDEGPKSEENASLRIWVPVQTAKNGSEAIRDYAIRYINDLEKQTLEIESRNIERFQDMQRDPMKRISNSHNSSR